MTAEDIHAIGMKLIKLSHSFGEHHKYRKDETRGCYDFTRNFGNNSELAFSAEKRDELRVVI